MLARGERKQPEERACLRCAQQILDKATFRDPARLTETLADAAEGTRGKLTRKRLPDGPYGFVDVGISEIARVQAFRKLLELSVRNPRMRQDPSRGRLCPQPQDRLRNSVRASEESANHDGVK
jgi:hypothetical protein